MQDYEIINSCLLCQNNKLNLIYNFGNTPLANELSEYQDYIPNDTFPLSLYNCEACQHCQLSIAVDQNRLYRDYCYVSGTSKSTHYYAENYAKTLIDKCNLKKGLEVLEIGSNDGTYLDKFRDLGMKVFGVDPAKNVAQIAKRKGIYTEINFFNEEVGKKIKDKYNLTFSLIYGNNMFAHNKDLDTIVKGVIEVLEDGGTFVFENSYLLDILDKNLFDTIYHEHIHTHSLTPLIRYFTKFGLKIIDVERVSNQGGSIRVYVAKKSDPRKVQSSVFELLELEKNVPAKLKNFATSIDKFKCNFSKFMEENREKVIDIYGFPAKLSTMLYTAEAKSEMFRKAYEDAELKVGKYSPGLHIPIVATEELMKDPPDILFIGAWNFADSIMNKCRELGFKGQFIIPMPKFKIGKLNE